MEGLGVSRSGHPKPRQLQQHQPEGAALVMAEEEEGEAKGEGHKGLPSTSHLQPPGSRPCPRPH